METFLHKITDSACAVARFIEEMRVDIQRRSDVRVAKCSRDLRDVELARSIEHRGKCVPEPVERDIGKAVL